MARRIEFGAGGVGAVIGLRSFASVWENGPLARDYRSAAKTFFLFSFNRGKLRSIFTGGHVGLWSFCGAGLVEQAFS